MIRKKRMMLAQIPRSLPIFRSFNFSAGQVKLYFECRMLIFLSCRVKAISINYINMVKVPSLVPRPIPSFQRATLKSWEWA